MTETTIRSSKSGYNRFLLLVAGLGGLLFGVDVGIIAGALPYLEASSKLDSNQLSFIVAAVSLGAMASTFIAGALADLCGRKRMMIFSGVLFVIAVPLTALSHSYETLILGRLLQGMSGGFTGVVVPLYLAECLSAGDRGKGTGIFQLLLTLGFVVAAFIGLFVSGRVAEFGKLGDAAKLSHFNDMAWRSIFWMSLPLGILFVIGSFLVSESPRWLFRRGKKEAALAVLLRSRSSEQAAIELQEMENIAEKARLAARENKPDSLLQRKYVVPFVLACIILACNQGTGVNSIIAYNPTMLIQAGLTDRQAHLGYLVFTIINSTATIGGIALVDRKGRRFLLSLGTAGVIVSLVAVGFLFRKTEVQRVDVRDAIQALVTSTNQSTVVRFNEESAAKFLAQSGKNIPQPKTLVVIYSCGDFRVATKVVRSDDPNAELVIRRESCLPGTKVSAFLKNPFASLPAARVAPLKIEHALITPVPSQQNGWLTAFLIYCFMASFAVGPGVCVWLVLSELMPTRIRSNGMSIALMLNIAVSTTVAALFLPTVGQYGYSTIFFIFAGSTVIYFVTATFFLPETKGKTLEEIEEHFEGGHV